MGSKEQAERLEILVTEKDKEIAALRKENVALKADRVGGMAILIFNKEKKILTLSGENAFLRQMVTNLEEKLKTLEKEVTDADPLYVKGYTREDGTIVKPYRKKK